MYIYEQHNKKKLFIYSKIQKTTPTKWENSIYNESYSYDANEFLTFLNENNIKITSIETDTLEHFHNHLNNTKHIVPTLYEKNYYIRILRFLAENKEIQSSPFDLSIIPKRSESCLSPYTMKISIWPLKQYMLPRTYLKTS